MKWNNAMIDCQRCRLRCVYYKVDICYSPSMQIVRHILTYLDGQSLLHIAGVSRRWRDVSEDEHVWHALCARLNIDESMQVDWMRHTFAVFHRSVDSSASPDTRYARVHIACPSKAAYMRYQCTAMNWRSRQAFVRTHEAGKCNN